MPRKKANIPANENNAQKFARLANERVNRILAGLKQVGALGNTTQYTSTAEQREKVVDALRKGVERAADQLKKGGEVPQEFKL